MNKVNPFGGYAFIEDIRYKSIYEQRKAGYKPVSESDPTLTEWQSFVANGEIPHGAPRMVDGYKTATEIEGDSETPDGKD
ncbi:MAG: hypothetical protein LUD72_13555 [Bacteroidales bacterium]|nr:hypothetical protein [Bacteroidales bacterium]